MFNNNYAMERYRYGCCTYRWVFSVDISTSMNLIKPWIIRWLFRHLFHQVGHCDQWFSTLGFDGAVSGFDEVLVDSVTFNPFLPASNGNANTDYGAALHNTVDLISLYMNLNTCAIFISDGGGFSVPGEIVMFLNIMD